MPHSLSCGSFSSLHKCSLLKHMAEQHCFLVDTYHELINTEFEFANGFACKIAHVYIGLKNIKETILLSSYSHALLQNEVHHLDLGFLKLNILL